MGIYLKDQDFYPALICREGAIYRADFIDVPDCRAYGASAIEAEINAGQALCDHVDMLRRYGRTIPEPSAIDETCCGTDRIVAYIRRPLPQSRRDARAQSAMVADAGRRFHP